MFYLFLNNNIICNLIGKEQVSELNVTEILHQNPLNQKNSDNEYLRFPSSPNSENGTNAKMILIVIFIFFLNI